MTFSLGFTQAYEELIGHEGTYSDHPNDKGGETYKGISRVHHPGWEGWFYVDEAKRAPGFPDSLKGSAQLEYFVRDFYKRNNWDIFNCDELPYNVGWELFEIGINMGVGTACKFLQRSLNAFNKQEKYWDDLVVDGAFGPRTLATTHAMVGLPDRDGPVALSKALNCLQGSRYIEIVENNESQEVFTWGWFERILG